MVDCTKCGMRDDDWFLCRKEDCEAGKDARIAALEAQLAEVKAERDVAVAAMVRNCNRADAAEARLSALEATAIRALCATHQGDK